MIFEKEEKLTLSNALFKANVMIKTVTSTCAPSNKVQMYAKGDGVPDYFECRIDAHSNVCDVNGIVVFPSCSGRHPAKRGDKGYFGFFCENFGTREQHPEFPRVYDDVYSGEWFLRLHGDKEN